MVDHGSCRYLLSGFQSFGCLLLEIRWATLAFCLLLGTRQVGYSVILELFSLKKTCLHADESSDTDLLLWFLQRWHFFLHLQFGNRRFAFIRVFIVVSYSTVHITLYQHLFFSIRFLHEHQHQFQQHSTEKTCNTDVCAKRSAHGCKQLTPPELETFWSLYLLRRDLFFLLTLAHVSPHMPAVLSLPEAIRATPPAHNSLGHWRRNSLSFSHYLHYLFLIRVTGDWSQLQHTQGRRCKKRWISGYHSSMKGNTKTHAYSGTMNTHTHTRQTIKSGFINVCNIYLYSKVLQISSWTF